MLDDTCMGYAGWAIWEYIAGWDSNDTSYASRFYRFMSIGSGWAVNFSSPDLDPKACSSRLVSLMTSSLKTFQFFRCWASN